MQRGEEKVPDRIIYDYDLLFFAPGFSEENGYYLKQMGAFHFLSQIIRFKSEAEISKAHRLQSINGNAHFILNQGGGYEKESLAGFGDVAGSFGALFIKLLIKMSR